MATDRVRRPVSTSLRISPARREILARTWPSAAAGVIAVVLLLALAWDAGGYFSSSYLAAGAVAFLTCAVLLAAGTPRYRISTPALVGLGALAALTVWTALSASWSVTPDTALEDAQRNLVYLGLFGLGLVAAGSGRLARHFVWLILGAIVIVSLAALLSRLYPDLIETSSPLGPLTGYRLDYPLTYWNALGALAAMGAVLGIGLAADTRAPAALRPLAAGGALIALTTMYLTFSRGAWMALAVGIVVLVALAVKRGSLLLSGGIVGLGMVLVVLRLEAYPALTEDPSAEAGQEAAGAAAGPYLLLILAGVIAAQLVIATMHGSPAVTIALRRVGRPLAIGLAAVAAVGFLVAYGIAGSKAEEHSAGAIDDAGRFVDRQWDDFLQPAGFAGTGSARLTTTRGTRSDVYRVAVDAFEAHPLRGDGSGAFEYRWMREREVSERTRDAHSLYLETLGELGLIGVLFLLVFIGTLVWAAVRSRLRPGGLGRSASAAVAGACSVWAVHAAVDWDWQMTALTGTALVLGATLYPYGQKRRRRRSRGGERQIWVPGDPKPTQAGPQAA
ncbi:MAG: O-antigen ligase family protein [Thermoleophilaceae bacterium]